MDFAILLGGIAMHATQDKIHAKIGHEDREEGEDHEEMVVAGVPEPRETLSVHRQTIDE